MAPNYTYDLVVKCEAIRPADYEKMRKYEDVNGDGP